MALAPSVELMTQMWQI